MRPALKRPNLRLVTDAMTDRLLLERKTVVGVRYRQGGQVVEALADGEVLLAAGAINSPKLLELSGVGNAGILQRLGIPVLHESPYVGENLQDHLQIRTVFKVEGAKTLNNLFHSRLGKVGIGLRYAFTQSGPMSMAPSQLGMFTKSEPSKATPDLEFHIQPLSTERLGDPLQRFSAITVSVCNLRPQSTGSVHALSRRPEEQPDIRLNYLSASEDKLIAVESSARREKS